MSPRSRTVVDWRHAITLTAVVVLAMVALTYLTGTVAPILSANVADDRCQFVDADGRASGPTDPDGRPDPLDPDCVSGGLGGQPFVTAEEAAAARSFIPDPQLLILGLVAAGVIVLMLSFPGAASRLGEQAARRLGSQNDVMRALVGGGIGLAVSLAVGTVLNVFWYPTGVALAIGIGAVIATARPPVAALVVWTACVVWLGVVMQQSPEGPATIVATLRQWGPVIGIWMVGAAIIGFAWLSAGEGRPEVRVLVLLALGIGLLSGGSLLWVMAVMDVANGSLFGLSVSFIWKALLLAGLASFAGGLGVALRHERPSGGD